MAESKEPIRLRQRRMPSGRTTLYLDIYINGRRTYETLKLYLEPAVTRRDKEKNKETLRLAEAIRAKRVVELQNGRFGFEDGYKVDTNFFAYYRKMTEERLGAESRGNWGNWYSCLRHLEQYARPDTTFRDITPEWVSGFHKYLDKAVRLHDKRKRTITTSDMKTLSQNSKQSYFNKLRACLNQAFEDGIIPKNPMRGTEGFKSDEVERVYLTFGEVKALAAAECRYPTLRRAFLFSCLTGLRKSDIMKMRWREVHEQDDGHVRIIFKQKKTKGQEYLDITPEAVQFLGERGKPDELVFNGFYYSSYVLCELKAWAQRAGVDKDITFHSGRHTFAVLMLDLGTDIYTVQKLLGHKDLHTTLIYAHILDKNKQEAVSRIPSILPKLEGVEG